MIELFSLFVDVLNVLFELDLFFSPLKGIGVEEFAIECSDLFGVLEEFGVGFFEFFFFF